MGKTEVFVGAKFLGALCYCHLTAHGGNFGPTFLGEIDLPLLILIAVLLFFVFGSPGTTVANKVWQAEAAPWEKVNAFYYPDKADFEAVLDLASTQECRDSVFAMAAAKGDPSLTRGDYECGVGKIAGSGGVGAYRVTTR